VNSLEADHIMIPILAILSQTRREEP
jgi:hypothetical protein